MRPRAQRLVLLACGSAVLLAGCVTETRTQLDRTVAAEVPLSETPESRREVHVDLIRKMLAQEQYYAALAHIQGQVRESGPRDELRLLEAQTRRQLGQDAEAQALYRELLKTKYTADAYHGLGLISAKTDQRTAIWQLQQAVQRRPTDSEMRNDLGYALMLAGRYREALPELATAVELAAGAGSAKARNNLILLALVTGDEAAVQRLTQQSDVSPEMLARLRKQAQSLRIRSTPNPAPARKN